MKLYLKVIVFLFVAVAEFGFVAPAMISAKDTLTALLGIGSMVCVVPILYIIGSRIFKEIKEKIV